MPRAAKGTITAHVTRVSQDEGYITTLIMSEAQLLELISLATVALREKDPWADGYHLAIWKELTVKNCQGNPPCEGGEAMVNLVRPGRRGRRPPTDSPTP